MSKQIQAILWKITSLYRPLYQWMEAGLSYTRKSSYIEETVTGINDLSSARKVVVFVHFDGKGTVHEFVMNYLMQFHSSGFSIIFVSNAPTLPPAQREKLTGLCSQIIRRKNIGYDFGAYKEGIAAIPDVSALDMLVLANDSVYGPLHHLASVLDRMDPDEADVWSASDSWEFAFHLQSYFLLFHRAALASPAFTAFWKRLRYIQSKTLIVRNYEVGLTRALRGAGLRCRAAYPYRAAATALMDAVMAGRITDDALGPIRKEYLLKLFEAINHGTPLNPTHFFWDYMIAQMDFPFLKRDLLQKNPARIPLLAYWERVIQQASDYDTGLIVSHLELALKKRSV